jgi:uncharacterized membrane protein
MRGRALGIAAGLWSASGLARLFFGGKEPSFYWSNGFFWLTISLFTLIFALEVRPMMTFIRMRSARKQGAMHSPATTFLVSSNPSILLTVILQGGAAARLERTG